MHFHGWLSRWHSRLPLPAKLWPLVLSAGCLPSQHPRSFMSCPFTWNIQTVYEPTERPLGYLTAERDPQKLKRKTKRKNDLLVSSSFSVPRFYTSSWFLLQPSPQVFFFALVDRSHTLDILAIRKEITMTATAI